MHRASAAILPERSSETCNGSADSQLTVPMLNGECPEEQRIADLEKELLLVESGQHPMLLEKLREIEQKQADELEMIEIMYEREKEEIERKFQLECATIQRELKEREEELVQTLLMEVDDRIRFIEAEVAALDVAGPACPTFSMNKKCLRRYQKGQALVVQTENYGAFAGMILSICEQYIQFRSTVPGL
ncbi:unnamed protein product [Angiostrongylus costaricensis]|uniref:Shootin-1 n=1 Tax=Angiostrongylus costaricensis TaxID=334426 RepID=A0A158PIF9_ANGCS|nr:unnamed protein product [Angiostrongylus costaricensis]